MVFESLIELLGTEVESPEEEAFSLFAQELPSQNLGFVDSKASVLQLDVAGRDLTIHQSPAVLSSNRAGGTTGAVVWKITPLFAEWIGAAGSSGTNTSGNDNDNDNDNVLFRGGVLSPDAVVLELGCGVSGIVGLTLAPRVSRYVLTDQAYVARLVLRNIAENRLVKAKAEPHRRRGSRKTNSSSSSSNDNSNTGNVYFSALDWETDKVTAVLTGSEEVRSFDAVIACDCIYNEALIDPLVSTCADACGLRTAEGELAAGLDSSRCSRPCVCIVAQQLRDSDVFESWLRRFLESFRVWRVPSSLLTPGLRLEMGFAVHLGILRDDAALT